MSGLAATKRSAPETATLMRAPDFIGRERELGALTRALDRGPAVIIIEGEAGIGKTRLLREFLASRAEPGPRKRGSRPTPSRRTVVATCPPLGTPHTLGPIVDAIRQATEGDVAAMLLSDLAGALRPLFPEWAKDLPPAPELPGDPSAVRHQVFSALAELLTALHTGVLAIEDGHWADEATLEFMLFLASRQTPAVNLVATCRPEDVPEGSLLLRLSRLATGSAGLRLTLGPLSIDETAGLMSSMLEGEPVSQEFAAFVHEHTEGLPLAVEESVRLMGERADLARRHDGSWVRRHLDDIAVPPSVRDAVLERAARLSRAAQEVLRAAAVLAVPSGDDLLAAVAGVPPVRVRSGLCEALDCGLLIETSLNGQGLASFRHVLAARAIYDSILAPRRRQLHERAGHALQQISLPPLDQLARHCREAGDTQMWCRYTEQAADTALAAGDQATAEVLLQDVVAEGNLPTGDAARLTSKISFATLTEPAYYQGLVSGLRSSLVTGNSQREDAEARFQLGRALTQAGHYEAGRIELEQAIPDLAPDSASAIWAMTLLGWPNTADWPASVHLRWLRRAVRITVPMAAADQLRFVVDRMTALLLLGENAGWMEAAKIPDDAPSAPERVQIARGYLNSGDEAVRWGRYQDAARRLAHALEFTEAHDYSHLHDMALAAHLRLGWFTGAWQGLAGKATAMAADEEMLPVTRLEASLVSGLLHAAAGAPDLAEQQLGSVLDHAYHGGVIECCMEPAAALARLRLIRGDIDSALKITDAPFSLVERKGVWVWATDIAPARAAALVAAGQTAGLGSLVVAFDRGLRGRDAPGPRAALATCRALLAEAEGRPARAAALLGQAAEAWDGLPRPYDALLVRERQAASLLASGQRTAGLNLLAETRQRLDALGATADAERLRRSLHAHGAAESRIWHGSRRGYGDQLSPREVEVVRLLVSGRTRGQIAQELCRSPKTVDTQFSSAMRKLNVSSRAALAVRAAEIGITPNGQP